MPGIYWVRRPRRKGQKEQEQAGGALGRNAVLSPKKGHGEGKRIKEEESQSSIVPKQMLAIPVGSSRTKTAHSEVPCWADMVRPTCPAAHSPRLLLSRSPWGVCCSQSLAAAAQESVSSAPAQQQTPTGAAAGGSQLPAHWDRFPLWELSGTLPGSACCGALSHGSLQHCLD